MFFLCLLIGGIQAASAQASCNSKSFDDVKQVKHVIDGDTVILQDNTHVRLLGINTPEMDHQSGKHDPGAIQARDYLLRALSGTRRVGLIYDNEYNDQYGRTLAHVFLTDGTNLQARLLTLGLAVPYVFPPNLKYIDCYDTAARAARERQSGLWKLPRNQPVKPGQLTAGESGFRVITGKVTGIYKSKRSLIIELNQNLRIFILNNNLEYFNTMEMDDLVGRSIQVHGRLDYREGVFWLQIRHPNDLMIITTL